MNWLLVFSGVLVMGLGVFHSLLGERYLVRRLLRRENLPHLFGGDVFTKRTIRYAWHLLTILCMASAAILFYAAVHEEGLAPIVRIIAISYGLCAAWGVIATRARHLSWVVLTAAAAGAAFGAM